LPAVIDKTLGKLTSRILEKLVTIIDF